MAGWDLDGMRALADDLVVTAEQMRAESTTARAALTSVDMWLAAPDSLVALATAVEQDAVLLDDRAARIEEADREVRIRLSSIGLDVSFPVGALLGDTSARIAAIESTLQSDYAAGLSMTIVDRLGSQLRELRRRRLVELTVMIEAEPSAALRAELAVLVQALGFGPAQVEAAVAAMGEGRSPAEAGLDPLLFPPGYVLAHRYDVQPLLEDIERIEWAIEQRRHLLLEIQEAVDAGAGHREIIEQYGYFPIGPDLELHELAIALAERTADVDRARRDVRVDVIDALGHFLSLPLPAQVVDAAAGPLLADLFLDRPAAVGEIADLLGTHDRAGFDGAFFERLGPAAAAMIPSRVAELAWGDSERARRMLRAYSESLGRAARRGLTWSGSDLVAFHDGVYPTYDPIELLRYGDFPPAFLVDAAMVLIDRYGHDDLYFPSLDPVVFGDTLEDPRELVLLRIGQDATAASRLIADLIATGSLSRFLMPELDYSDLGRAAGLVLASGVDGDGALQAVIGALALGADAVPDGLALGLVAVLDREMSLLVPSGREYELADGRYGLRVHDYVHDPRLDELVSEAEIHRVLELIVASDIAADALLLAAGSYLGSQLRGVPPSEMAERADELGALIGRICAIRVGRLVAEGRRHDEAAEAWGDAVSVLVGAAVAVGIVAATGGAGAALAVEILLGGATDYAAGYVFDLAVPADGEVSAYRSALEDDTLALEYWRVLAVTAIEEADPDYFGDHAPPRFEDGTLQLPWPVVTDTRCYPWTTEHRDQFYAWLHSLPDHMRRAVEAIATAGMAHRVDQGIVAGSD